MEWLLIAGLFIAVNVGIWLYVKAYNRRPSEYQQTYVELARSINEVKAAIGEALMPPLQRMVDTLSTIIKRIEEE